MSNLSFTLISGLVLSTSMSVLAVMDGQQDMQQTQESYYCDMVELHKRTDGENGWPDYKDNYAEVCGEQ